MLHHQPGSSENQNSDRLGDHGHIYAVVRFSFYFLDEPLLSIAALILAFRRTSRLDRIVRIVTWHSAKTSHIQGPLFTVPVIFFR